MDRVYDRRRPADLPAHKMLSRAAPPHLSLVKDLRGWAGRVKDQGSEGGCTGFAGHATNEWIQRRYFSRWPVLSPQFLYSEELIAQGSFPSDVGSDGTTLCEVLISKGCCLESDYPYVPGQILRPSLAQESAGAVFKLGAYHGVSDSTTAVSVLGDPTPWPIMIGFDVYASFESDATALTGVMTVPVPGESLLGGHEVCCLGYDIAPTPILRPASMGPAFLIQNSWGTGWGLHGYFWMPASILDQPSTDLKVAHTGAAWARRATS
jgi:C1A family cysteine protease